MPDILRVIQQGREVYAKHNAKYLVDKKHYNQAWHMMGHEYNNKRL